MKERWKRGKREGNWEKERKNILKDRMIKKREEEKMKYGEIEQKDRGSLKSHYENIEG